MPRITISEPGRTPQPYRLKTDREITKIGRASDNDIILETGSASTYHCEMKRVEGGFILKDNDSTNGILLEDTRFKIIDLEDGITVSIGEDIDFNFELSEEELELLEEEDFEPRQQAAFPKSKAKPVKKKAIELDDEEEDEFEEVVVRRKKKKKAVSLLDDDDEDEDEDEDNDDELEEARPKKKSSSANASSKPKLKSPSGATPTPRAVAPMESSKSSGIGTTLVFAALAVVFLVGGMVIRHYQDHGTFLFEKKIDK